MNITPIEWSQNPDGTSGYTFNPFTGCRNHNNGLCRGGGFPCYAYGLANGRLKGRYLANEHLTPQGLLERRYDDPFYPRLWPERLEQARKFLSRGKPKGIFVCDMSDLFGIGVPESWTKMVLNFCREFPQHRFYLLTKQPQNLQQWSPYPPNCYVGVTATSIEMLINACSSLRSLNHKMKYISFEPLLDGETYGVKDLIRKLFIDASISWLIIGAQTKPLRLPKIEWVKEIVEAADKVKIPVFLKDNLRTIIPERQRPFWYVDHYESHLRQEMPDA